MLHNVWWERIPCSGWPLTKLAQCLLCSWGEICTFQCLPAGGQFTQPDGRHGPAHSVLQVTMVLRASFSGGHCACLFIIGNADCQMVVPTTCTEKIKPFLQLFLPNLAPLCTVCEATPLGCLPRSLLSDVIVVFPTLDDLFQQNFHDIAEQSLQTMPDVEKSHSDPNRRSTSTPPGRLLAWL